MGEIHFRYGTRPSWSDLPRTYINVLDDNPHSGRGQRQPEQGAIDRAQAHFWIERNRLDLRAVVAFLFADPANKPRRSRSGTRNFGWGLSGHPLRNDTRLLAAVAEEAVTAIRRRPPTTAERIAIADAADRHIYRES